jgi:hypothetical protein
MNSSGSAYSFYRKLRFSGSSKRERKKTENETNKEKHPTAHAIPVLFDRHAVL